MLAGQSACYLNVPPLKLAGRRCLTKHIPGQLMSIFSNTLSHHVFLARIFYCRSCGFSSSHRRVLKTWLGFLQDVSSSAHHFFNGCCKSTHGSPRHWIPRRKPKLCTSLYIFKSLVYVAVYRLFHFTALKSLFLNCKTLYGENYGLTISVQESSVSSKHGHILQPFWDLFCDLKWSPVSPGFTLKTNTPSVLMLCIFLKFLFIPST